MSPPRRLFPVTTDLTYKPPAFKYFYDYLRLVKQAVPYKLLYFSKVSLLLVFSVGGGKMGTVPCATKTILCLWSWTCCFHESYSPSSIQYSSFDSLPNYFAGEQDHTEQTQEDPGKHIVVLEVVFLDSSSRSLYRENDHCFWWFLQISCLNLAFSQEEVIGPKKKRKVSEPEKLLLEGRKWCSFWHILEGVSSHCHLAIKDLYSLPIFNSSTYRMYFCMFICLVKTLDCEETASTIVVMTMSTDSTCLMF